MLESDARQNSFSDSAPRLPVCACCHKAGTDGKIALLLCSGCRKRRYCSKECQLRDWKGGGNHRHRCGTVGEDGHDWEARLTVPSGEMHVFALRRIMRTQHVLTDVACLMLPEMPQEGGALTSLFILTENTECESALHNISALRALTPLGADLTAKYRCNAVRWGPDGWALFPTFALIKNSSDPNCDFCFLPKSKEVLVVASRQIEAGEPLTVHRTAMHHVMFDATRSRVTLPMPISMTGVCCASHETESRLWSAIYSNECGKGNSLRAMRAGKALVHLYESKKDTSCLARARACAAYHRVLCFNNGSVSEKERMVDLASFYAQVFFQSITAPDLTHCMSLKD